MVVSEKLALWIGLFGPPHILQCDNGTEFKDTVLLLLKKYGIKVLNGRPRHPQTQGLVEKHNSTLKRKLQAWIQDSGCRHWAQALPEISLSMNHQIHSTTGESPYRVVFKKCGCSAYPLQTEQLQYQRMRMRSWMAPSQMPVTGVWE